MKINVNYTVEIPDADFERELARMYLRDELRDEVKNSVERYLRMLARSYKVKYRLVAK